MQQLAIAIAITAYQEGVSDWDAQHHSMLCISLRYVYVLHASLGYLP